MRGPAALTGMLLGLVACGGNHGSEGVIGDGGGPASEGGASATEASVVYPSDTGSPGEGDAGPEQAYIGKVVALRANEGATLSSVSAGFSLANDGALLDGCSGTPLESGVADDQAGTPGSHVRSDGEHSFRRG